MNPSEEPTPNSTSQELAGPCVDNSDWYKTTVLYEVYIRAFCDVNGDGKGDIEGLISKLDYLQELGVYCIWVLPLYPSPLKDDGYDVSDYCGVHPDYGSLKDVERLIKAAHERSMKIIFDFIPNHCSNQHHWFQEARKSRNNPYRDYFVWSDTPTKYNSARVIFLDVEPSNWTWDPVAEQYYWHRFYAEQPDLNFENPAVQNDMLNVVKFWMDMGIDGFRCDAVPYLFEEEGTNCENLPQTHTFLKRMRKFIDDNYPGRIMLAEACQPPDQVREYFADGDEFQMGFHFPIMPHMYKALASANWVSLKDVLDHTPDIPKECQWVTFLRNHDELSLEMVSPMERQWMWNFYASEPRMRVNLGIRRRLAPLMENDRRKIEALHCMLLTMPGTPILYYGDEIGMGDNIWLDDRNGVRTPMQWTPASKDDPTAGFSADPCATPFSPIISEEPYDPQHVNVQDALNDASSWFHVLKFMIRVRKSHPCFSKGTLSWVASNPPNISVATFIRQYEISSILVVINLSPKEQRVCITLPSVTRHARYDWKRPSFPSLKRIDVENLKATAIAIDNLIELRDELTLLRYPITTDNTIELDLAPYQFLWLNLREAVFKY